MLSSFRQSLVKGSQNSSQFQQKKKEKRKTEEKNREKKMKKEKRKKEKLRKKKRRMNGLPKNEPFILQQTHANRVS